MGTTTFQQRLDELKERNRVRRIVENNRETLNGFVEQCQEFAKRNGGPNIDWSNEYTGETIDLDESEYEIIE